MNWLIERPLYCRKCGMMITLFSNTDDEAHVNAVIKGIAECPRCHRKLDISRKEYHHEYYFTLKSIIWKLTHPWRLFK